MQKQKFFIILTIVFAAFALPALTHASGCELPGKPSKVAAFTADDNTAVIKTATGNIISFAKDDQVFYRKSANFASRREMHWRVLRTAAQNFSKGEDLFVLAYKDMRGVLAEPAFFVDLYWGSSFCERMQTVGVQEAALVE